MQPYFDRLSRLLSVRLGDTVSSYLTNGVTYSALKREQAINEAVGSLYEAELLDFAGKDMNRPGVEKFMNSYPEYRDEITVGIAAGNPSSKAIEKEQRVRQYFTAHIYATVPAIADKVAYPLTAEQYHRAMNREHSNFKASIEHPRFFVKSTSISIEIGGVQNQDTITDGSVKFVVLLQPVYTAQAPDGDDILAPESWEQKIVAMAAEIAVAGRQR